jgi:hypothetical protein
VRPADIARLLALAIIWSASFVFIRVLAPVLGPVWVATGRLLLGGAVLTGVFVVTRTHVDLTLNWRAYLFIGVLNSALPFVLFAYAALTLPASYLVLLNAALPLFGALASAVWLAESLDAAKRACRPGPLRNEASDRDDARAARGTDRSTPPGPSVTDRHNDPQPCAPDHQSPVPTPHLKMAARTNSRAAGRARDLALITGR